MPAEEFDAGDQPQPDRHNALLRWPGAALVEYEPKPFADDPSGYGLSDIPQRSDHQTQEQPDDHTHEQKPEPSDCQELSLK